MAGYISASTSKSEIRYFSLTTTDLDAAAAQVVIREAYHHDRDIVIFLVQGNHAYKISSDLIMSFTSYSVDQDKVEQRVEEMTKELQGQGSITFESVSDSFFL